MITLFRRARRVETPTPVKFRPGLYVSSAWQPPRPVVDPGPVPWTPPYADLTLAQVLRRYGDTPADIARRFLRHAAAEQRGTRR